MRVGFLTVYYKKRQKVFSAAEIADVLEESVENIQKIYEEVIKRLGRPVTGALELFLQSMRIKKMQESNSPTFL